MPVAMQKAWPPQLRMVSPIFLDLRPVLPLWKGVPHKFPMGIG